jgi:phenylacetate-CoA ligase
MNLRGRLYLAAHRANGSKLPIYYQQFRLEDAALSHAEIADELLGRMLAHCAASVPYYRNIMRERDISLDGNPADALAQMPILTKPIVRAKWEALKSDDLDQRSWVINASGGSTGEPLQMIQDTDHAARVDAQQQLYTWWVGADIGDRQVYLWGSDREVLAGSLGWKIVLANLLTDRTLVNSFRLTPAAMRHFLHVVDTQRPKVIIAYAQALYETARLAEREGIPISPQQAIITSAETLYPFMRETLERVFGCKVFDRYGSREVGDIAGECSMHDGLHVLPWGSYVEIVDDAGMPVSPGVEGRVLVTCLTNEAMPLVRYEIGDRAVLSPRTTCSCGRSGQILERVTGRTADLFVAADGTLVASEYFNAVVVFRPWVWNFQVTQVAVDSVIYKIIRTETPCLDEELADITEQTRAVMGASCHVGFEFVDEIPPTPSGKHRFTISLVTQ